MIKKLYFKCDNKNCIFPCYVSHVDQNLVYDPYKCYYEEENVDFKRITKEQFFKECE